MEKCFRRISLFFIPMFVFLFLTSCSSNRKFEVKAFYATCVFDTGSSSFVRPDDVIITGVIGDNEISIPAKQAFAEIDMTGFDADIGETNAVGGSILGCLYITFQNENSEECSIEIRPGDKIDILSEDFPVFLFE